MGECYVLIGAQEFLVFGTGFTLNDFREELSAKLWIGHQSLRDEALMFSMPCLRCPAGCSPPQVLVMIVPFEWA